MSTRAVLRRRAAAMRHTTQTITMPAATVSRSQRAATASLAHALAPDLGAPLALRLRARAGGARQLSSRPGGLPS